MDSITCVEQCTGVGRVAAGLFQLIWTLSDGNAVKNRGLSVNGHVITTKNGVKDVIWSGRAAKMLFQQRVQQAESWVVSCEEYCRLTQCVPLDTDLYSAAVFIPATEPQTIPSEYIVAASRLFYECNLLCRDLLPQVRAFLRDYIGMCGIIAVLNRVLDGPSVRVQWGSLGFHTGNDQIYDWEYLYS